MKVIISSPRQFHYRLPANSLARRGHDVTMFTSTPRSRLRNLSEEVQTQFVPSPLNVLSGMTHMNIPKAAYEWDSVLYDSLAARALSHPNMVIGAASLCLSTLKAAHKQNGVAVLDRACPHIQFQEDLLTEEAMKVGGTYTCYSAWFMERQFAEYEEADVILSPSNYSKSSFSDKLQKKIILSPLFGRAKVMPLIEPAPSKSFTVGVVGGEPLRKGYLYLLQAWKKLAWTNGKLLIRSSPDMSKYPALKKLLGELPSVEIVPYVADIADFYKRCDAFILPSVDDGFGMALFEAIGNGVPSVATRNTGATELLTDEKDFLLIDAQSADQIVDALGRLYESPDLRRRLSATGRKTVEALIEGESARPYEEAMDRLLNAASVAQAKGSIG